MSLTWTSLASRVDHAFDCRTLQEDEREHRFQAAHEGSSCVGRTRARERLAVQSSSTRGDQIMVMDITKGSTRVYIDPKRCIANAKCTTAAPGVYALDEETGVAVIENPDDATVEQLFAGARACPTQAIIIEQFGRRVYPVILTPMFGESKEESKRVDE
jgi:ferredoxin